MKPSESGIPIKAFPSGRFGEAIRYAQKGERIALVEIRKDLATVLCADFDYIRFFLVDFCEIPLRQRTITASDSMWRAEITSARYVSKAMQWVNVHEL